MGGIIQAGYNLKSNLVVECANGAYRDHHAQCTFLSGGLCTLLTAFLATRPPGLG